jgi:predicted Fe-Mo cluster-binding NifX family protein
MKIAVSSTGASIDDRVEERFGRCPYLIIMETDDMSAQILENKNAQLGGGAGIRSAELVAETGARVVLTGRCGPNASQALEAAGVQVISDVSGTVRAAVEEYIKEGENT